MGYSFAWPAGEQPYFVLPSGFIVYLEVRDNIPYLRAGAPMCKPRRPVGKKCFACAGPVASDAAEGGEPPEAPNAGGRLC